MLASTDLGRLGLMLSLMLALASAVTGGKGTARPHGHVDEHHMGVHRWGPVSTIAPSPLHRRQCGIRGVHVKMILRPP